MTKQCSFYSKNVDYMVNFRFKLRHKNQQYQYLLTVVVEKVLPYLIR